MADVALRQGAVLDDRFMLKRQLGAGGCGAVWLASDAETKHSDVVLKILHPHFDKYSLAVKQLAREAEVLSQLAHPNIAKPFLFSASGQHTYLAMEFIDGRSLDLEIGAHTKADKYIANDELLAMFEGMCSAVQHAHSRTIIHRDLKPQNVMILRRAGQVFVKVLDFGIAKLIEGNAFDATTFGRRLGSMFYMSPEQCKGEPADVRSDVFALGVVLFEALTLRRAWAWDPQGRPMRAFDAPLPADGANSISTVLLRIATAPRPKPSDVRPKLPPKMDELVTRAMAIEPERRFATVEQFLAELRRAIKLMGGGEFATEIVTVRSAAPAVKPVQGDSDTNLDVVPEPEHVRRSIKVERTEALAEVKERENSAWRAGGIQPADMAATAMMAQVEDPDGDSADHTVPKVPRIDSDLPLWAAAAPILEESSGMSGPTLGLRESLFEEQKLPPSHRGRVPQAPLDTGRTDAAEDPGETAIAAEPTHGDPSGTVRGALAPETRTDGVRPSWRGKLPPPDPNATAISEGASGPQDMALGFMSGDSLGATPLNADIKVDPKVMTGAGGTELLFAVAEPKQLAPEAVEDRTPIHAAELEIVSREIPALPQARVATVEQRVSAPPAQPFASAPSATAPVVPELNSFSDVVRALLLAVHRHRLAFIGAIGMVLAFVVGVMLARWAADQVRRSTPIEVRPAPVRVPEPAPVKPAPVEAPAPELDEELAAPAPYPALESLLDRLKQSPTDRALMAELRDQISEAADDVASDRTRQAIKRAVQASAKNGDVEGLEAALRKLERARLR